MFDNVEENMSKSVSPKNSTTTLLIKNLGFVLDWQNPAPVPGSRPPSVSTAPLRGVAPSHSPGPDPGTGAGFC